jgi:hypothetical protein
MKYLISLLLLAGTAPLVRAQHLTPEVLTTAGESYAASNLYLDWTLGELMTETYAGTIVLTQGFHQPGLDQTTSIRPPAVRLGSIKVYPNPTSGSLTIDREGSGAWQAAVLDLQGRLLMQQRLPTATSQLDLSHLPAGMYLLRLSDGGQGMRSVRIEKW